MTQAQSYERLGKVCIVPGCEQPLTGRQRKYCKDHSNNSSFVRMHRLKHQQRAKYDVWAVMNGVSPSKPPQDIPSDLWELPIEEFFFWLGHKRFPADVTKAYREEFDARREHRKAAEREQSKLDAVAQGKLCVRCGESVEIVSKEQRKLVKEFADYLAGRGDVKL